MEEIRGRNFDGVTVDMDNRYFVNCKFSNCEIRFRGAGDTKWTNTQFLFCDVLFADAAAATVHFLIGMNILGENFSREPIRPSMTLE